MTDEKPFQVAPLDPEAWGLAGDGHRRTREQGRSCLRFADENLAITLPGVEFEDGVLEVDLAVSGQRSFHGVIWRSRDAENHESFFVRPHQVGNPDSIQYTPVNHDISSWQLYHGPGFWAPVAFPIDRWFTIRIAFAGHRAEAFVGDLAKPALRIAELKRPPMSGGIGLQVGGPGLRVARFAYRRGRPSLDVAAAPTRPAGRGAILGWQVSDPFGESELDGAKRIPPDVLASRRWTAMEAEPSGLLDLSRASGIRDGRNTILVRAVVTASHDGIEPLEFGFSDRAVVFLNGQALFRGDDSYRSRDYRFLGSIGFWDTIFLPLRSGENELVVGVSEDLGGWGIQARLVGENGASGGAPARLAEPVDGQRGTEVTRRSL